jgi:hypothetical protein
VILDLIIVVRKRRLERLVALHVTSIVHSRRIRSHVVLTVTNALVQQQEVRLRLAVTPYRAISPPPFPPGGGL